MWTAGLRRADGRRSKDIPRVPPYGLTSSKADRVGRKTKADENCPAIAVERKVYVVISGVVETEVTL